MKKTITILGALVLTGCPALTLDTTAHKTQNFENILNRANPPATNLFSNEIDLVTCTDYVFKFDVILNNSVYNGFSAYLDQVYFLLSEYNYHAWILYLLQWLDDGDFHVGPMPDLHAHAKYGYINWPVPFNCRLEWCMSHFGAWQDNKSQTAFSMGSSWGQWATFGQNVDNQYKAAEAAKTAYGIDFQFGFNYTGRYYTTDTPSFYIIKAQS